MKHLPMKVWLIGLLMASSVSSSAQVLDRLGKKMEDKINRRIDRKIDRAMDKTLDKTEETIDGSVKNKDTDDSSGDQDSSSSASFSAFNMTNVPTESSYVFDYVFDYEVTMVSEKETSKMTYNMRIPDSDDMYVVMNMVEMESEGMNEEGRSAMKDMTVIMDGNNNGMVMINDKEKSYMSMKMPKVKEEDLDSSQQDVSITKTGRTKTILGYLCEEYHMESEEYSGVSWVTKDPKFANVNPFKKMQNNQNSTANFPSSIELFEGLMLEMDMTMKKVKKKKDMSSMTLKVKRIKNDRIIINMSDYKNSMEQ